jgi:hypothetical protein
VLDVRQLCSVGHSRNQAWKIASLQGSESSRIAVSKSWTTPPERVVAM